MSTEIHDLELTLRALKKRQLNIPQASALFREQKDAAWVLLTDRLPALLRNPELKISRSARDVPNRILEVCWQVFGSDATISTLISYSRDPDPAGEIVQDFLAQKLRSAPDLFTDDHLSRLQDGFREKPLWKEIMDVRGRRLIPIANRLLKNPAELNQDVKQVKKRVSQYSFNPELNGLLDKVEVGLGEGGDRFDQAAHLAHLRTFFEALHRQVAERLHEAEPASKDGTDLTKCQQVIDYLKRTDVIEDAMMKLGRGLYAVLSEKGAHAISSEREYVRLCRNMVAEYALVVFFELERRIG